VFNQQDYILIIATKGQVNGRKFVESYKLFITYRIFVPPIIAQPFHDGIHFLALQGMVISRK
jgi:hypothetical protein